MARSFVVAILLVQVLLATAALSPSPSAKPEAPSPEDQEAALEADLADLGVPASEIRGRIIPGANQVQINAALTNIINGRLAESYQRSVAAANQNAQQVLAALGNSTAVSALSPSGHSQYEAVVELAKNPKLANPPATTATAGRRLKHT